MPPNKPTEVNGWAEWSKYVLKELERLNDQLDKMTEKMDAQNIKFHADITDIKIETAKHGAVWGFLAGLVPLAISVILHFMK
jgi:uncharacterized protein (UPF0276 family)